MNLKSGWLSFVDCMCACLSHCECVPLEKLNVKRDGKDDDYEQQT